jgi:hypothetical protein
VRKECVGTSRRHLMFHTIPVDRGRVRDSRERVILYLGVDRGSAQEQDNLEGPGASELHRFGYIQLGEHLTGGRPRRSNQYYML